MSTVPWTWLASLRCGGWVMAVMLATTGWAQTQPEKTPPAAEPRSPAADIPPNPFPNRVPAVELAGGVEWLNTAAPLSLKQLRGKVVLLDFWTFCCINCIHVIPDLKYLEAKYPNELVVIGVHSAKFDNEKETGNIRQAILRYEIEHPVVNDAEMLIWRRYNVHSWPTLVLIDPEGFYCGYVSGEGNRDLLDQVIQKVIAHHRAKGTLNETPLRFDLERAKEAASPLRFPGKLLADEASQRLFISDSNHNRIVVTRLDGELLEVIGSGRIGKRDGSFAEAEFDHPQGLALVGETLYVADTENHLLRQVDLREKTVSTLAGTGEQGHLRAGQFPLREARLNSPWDLLHLDGVLYICMAGPHQIWSHRLGSNTIQPYAGSGREDIRNGMLSEAALAQPSGITTDGTHLYVCDSEGSAIRQITTQPNNDLKNPAGEVTTLVGTSDLPNGRALFEFGDKDGVGSKVRLQHPLGIVFHDGFLYVADSYNHKIKRINVKTRTCTTWLGTGKPGESLDPPQFAEPAGLSVAGGRLYVADTNNHRICVVDLLTKDLTVLPIPGLKPPAAASQSSGLLALGEREVVPVQRIAPGPFVEFEVTVKLPDDFKLNPAAPAIYQLTAAQSQTLIAADQLNSREEARTEGSTLKFRVPLAETAGEATFYLVINFQYCRDGEQGACKLGGAQYAIPLKVSQDGNGSVIRLTATAR